MPRCIDGNPNPNYTLPFGEQQGSFRGVVACSNRDDGFFSGESNYVNQLLYTGFRYQCVEYARRFLLLTTGCVFGNCGRASEVYKMRHITHVETGEEYPLEAHDNGKTNVKPKPGDIILYPFNDQLTPWGHIGIISYVDDTKVGIIEQNQFFGEFVSPSPDYLDGERCVARMIDITHDPEANTYTLVENTKVLPHPLGWMTYDTAPSRLGRIYDRFNPLESMKAVRSTPFDDPRHPSFTVLTLDEGIPVPGGRISRLFGANNSGEYFVGVGTALSRILRYTLQTLFKRCQLGPAFLSLPSNPLHAELPKELNNAPLNALFESLESVMHKEGEEARHILLQAVATYFDLPLPWVKAMQREYSRGELCLCASSSFVTNFEEEEVSSPVTRVEAGGHVQIKYACNPHDEVLSIGKVSFAPPRLFVSLTEIEEVKDQLANIAGVMLPTQRVYQNYGFRVDVGRYIRDVEVRRGPRTGFTIVVCKHMDTTQLQLVQVMQDCCERLKYPVRVIAETDLTYSNGKLLATPTSDTPSSPLAKRDSFEADFVMLFSGWEEVLRNEGGYYQALYDAAVDEGSDVVFAQPIWTFLCTGVTNKVDPQYSSSSSDGGYSDCKATSNSLQFYDICRRYYALSQPPQDADKWDMEISEYKDSCRRIRIDALIKERPPMDIVVNCCVVNFAYSATMAHSNGRLIDNTNGEYDGQPAAMMHLFKITEDDE